MILERKDAFDVADNNGSLYVIVDPNGTGTWGDANGVVYTFYVSWLFDNELEELSNLTQY